MLDDEETFEIEQIKEIFIDVSENIKKIMRRKKSNKRFFEKNI